MSSYTKDPSAVLDYAFDWTAWLSESEVIDTAVITVSPGLTKASQSIDGGIVTAWLSGGTRNAGYDVACLITTDQGRTDERTIRITVRDR